MPARGARLACAVDHPPAPGVGWFIRQIGEGRFIRQKMAAPAARGALCATLFELFYLPSKLGQLSAQFTLVILSLSLSLSLSLAALHLPKQTGKTPANFAQAFSRICRGRFLTSFIASLVILASMRAMAFWNVCRCFSTNALPGPSSHRDEPPPCCVKTDSQSKKLVDGNHGLLSPRTISITHRGAKYIY